MRRDDHDLQRLWDRFHALVNMTSPELRDWRATAAAMEQPYGPDPDVDLSELDAGVLALLQKRRVDCTDADVQMMRAVVDMVSGWLANAPADGAQDRLWRYRLLSVGHDPLRADSPRGRDARNSPFRTAGPGRRAVSRTG